MSDVPSLIDADVEGYVDYEIVEDLKQPYNVKIIDAEDRSVEVEGITRPLTEFTFSITDSGLTNPKAIQHTLWHPHASMTPEMNNNAKGKIIRFQEAFGKKATDEYKGMEAKAYLGKKTTTSKSSGEKYVQNTIRRFLKDDAGSVTV